MRRAISFNSHVKKNPTTAGKLEKIYMYTHIYFEKLSYLVVCHEALELFLPKLEKRPTVLVRSEIFK